MSGAVSIASKPETAHREPVGVYRTADGWAAFDRTGRMWRIGEADASEVRARMEAAEEANKLAEGADPVAGFKAGVVVAIGVMVAAEQAGGEA